jgi:glyoxylase-like metal-dependent hydrolase (beta-lactamase superfamily II)
MESVMGEGSAVAETATFLRWRIGDVIVTRVPEHEMRVPVEQFIPAGTPADLARHPWLVPDFATAEGVLRLSIHGLAIEAPGLRVLVDPCFGEGKSIPDYSMILEKQGDFLAGLASIGFTRDNVDVVLCTHLHIDHVGWNTIWENGRWAPTFPNARYLFGRTEYEFWQQTGPNQEMHSGPTVMRESVRPVVEAGLAELVETDHRLSSELRLVPSPGHSPGHASLMIESGGASAVITGDMMHHPCQIPHAGWAMPFDDDPALTVTTRERLLGEWEASGILVIGTHFAAPTAGRIGREAGGLRRFDCRGETA